MPTVDKFEELEIWKSARILSVKVYDFIKLEGFSNDYRLKNQITGSCGSIMDNIAEGFERGSKFEFIQFLGYAKGSAGECKSQLYRAFDQKYITKVDFDNTYDLTDRISKGINKFISYLNKSNYSGEKFKDRRV